MIFLTNVYNDIIGDFVKEQYKESKVLSRRFEFKDNVVMLISVYKKSQLCEVSVAIDDNVTSVFLNSMPKWKGWKNACLSFMMIITEKENFYHLNRW